MPRIPPLTTLRAEDFAAEQRKWLPRLLLPLNQFLTNASNALNGRIEFGANIPAQDNVLTFSFNGTAQRYRWNLSLPPTILWVGQATENGIPVSLLPEWSFDPSTQNILIGFVTTSGAPLVSGRNYRIFVRAVP